MAPAPAVQAYCYLPRLNRGRKVDFLIDTGAAGTCLHGGYALGLQSYMQENTIGTICGIGGSRPYFQERAILVFTDDKAHPVPCRTALGVQKILPEDIAKDPDILRMPCVLGRDVLNRWEFRYDVPHGEILLIVP